MDGLVLSKFGAELEKLKKHGQYRQLQLIEQHNNAIKKGGQLMVNLSSNDYLGIAGDVQLREEFLQTLDWNSTSFSASSSRLLTGNCAIYDDLENQLSKMFNAESALVFNSGYHMNIGILPAVTDTNTLILADKLIHASLIDGIRLSKGKCIRYRHADYEQLEKLVETHSNQFEQIMIVTESIFSMDGDVTDLRRLAGLKQKYPNVLLYIDEAHAIGVRGHLGLGCAEEQGCIAEIDFLVGTFGKALGLTGGYIVCRRLICDYLINKMRTLIYTTAISPVNLMWSKFVLERLPNFQDRRQQLRDCSARLRIQLTKKGYDCTSQSHIVPLIIVNNEDALIKAKEIQKHGFYLLPLRPPTVPEGTSRLRISLTSNVTKEDIHKLLEYV